MKKGMNESRKCCPGHGCLSSCGNWCMRNWIHVILLTAAVGAVIGAIIGSLDSCNDEIRNVTVTRSVLRNVTRTRNVSTTVEIVNHLDAIVLIDGSGSMCYNSANTEGCTSGTCPADASSYCATFASGCTCDEDRWSQAKTGIEYLNNQLNISMNANVTSQDNKLQTGLITWSTVSESNQNDYLMINAPLQSGVETTNTIAESINLPTGGTYWGTGLCQCYKQLQTNGVSGANKLCFLMADGDLSDENLGGFPSCASDGNRGANGACPCDYLWNDVSTLGWSSSQYTNPSSAFVEEFMKSQNITISSILVGSNVDGARIFQAASCDGISWDSNTGAPVSPCDNYLKLTSFSDLTASAQNIAAKQRSLASVTQTVTDTETITEQETSTEEEFVSGSVSVCSLDFLYALFAFVPFLAYLMYRIVVIKAMSKTVRKQLYEMIRDGALTRDDMRHFATVATNLLLPKNFISDVDWIISWILFQCPCLLPASKADLEAVFAATTIAL